MARLSLSLLGTFQATLDGEPIAGFESVKVRALLAYLAVEADRPHHRGSLAGLLWPDRPDRSARANLRHALSVLRKAIADHQVPPPTCRSHARRSSSTPPATAGPMSRPSRRWSRRIDAPTAQVRGQPHTFPTGTRD